MAGTHFEVSVFEAPALTWEPCAEAHDHEVSGVCEGCGWPVIEHGAPIDVGVEGGVEVGVAEPAGAIVIPVPERPRLRRAS